MPATPSGLRIEMRESAAFYALARSNTTFERGPGREPAPQGAFRERRVKPARPPPVNA